MQLAEAMAALEAAGTEQNRKIYRRHGMPDPLFGVSFAVFGKLQKSIKRDQALADALWATGNGDARLLASMIADPAAAPLERWAAALDNYFSTDIFVKHVAAPAPGAWERARTWIDADGEWIERAGWSTLTHLAMGKLPIADDEWLAFLPRIERAVQGAKNRVRDGMLGLVAAIGLRNEALRGPALAAAARIGHVEVDHGETSCETIDAAGMIERGWARKAGKPLPPKRVSAGAKKKAAPSAKPAGRTARAPAKKATPAPKKGTKK